MVVTMRGLRDFIVMRGGRLVPRGWRAGSVAAVALAVMGMLLHDAASHAREAAASGAGKGITSTATNSTATGEANANTNATNTNPTEIARGAYLAKAADCAGCHTAPPRVSQPGAKPVATPPFAGGLGMGSPFGTIYSSNITPDPEAGIGRYSYEDFARALREGVARGGKRLYPAMPYPSFSKITDDDMHALYAYFMHGVQPVPTPAPTTRLPFPFNQRWALLFWDWVFAPTGQYRADPAHDVQWNRGAYLVQSLGHCGACHTPRGPAFNERGYSHSSSTYLTGGTNDNWFASNLTADPGSGLGRFSADDIAAFLKAGHGGGLVTFGSMVQVVEDSTQYLSDADRAAIAAYLKSLPSRAPNGRFNANSRAAQQTVRALRTGDVERPGAGIYATYCARCHQMDGAGVPQKYPRLAGNPAVLGASSTSLVRLLVEGGESPHTLSGPEPRKMPSFTDKLTDNEMARVLTFIRNTWGNAAAPVTSRDVSRVRAKLGK
ncbi:mono/diheme cytochrome c family protein [Paraburkholderia graminis]|jgi:mono/diheme cytochrome c family protein|uniref:Mono/diheme cytochrome c family protein n=2 Tax=Paraburkholderia graminis TaxID=60548 RepID=A0ABD5CQK4_9BURK|nr:mono/diheme cytochrome c family protein [Paraburkholderia graminis]MDR6206805.1 mono/diheme cytochrome c family protein [Paraburkholderia graminis]